MRTAIAALALTLAVATPAAAATFDFTDATGAAPSFTFTVGGVGLTVTGGTINDDLSGDAAENVGQSAGGLGVVGLTGEGGNDSSGNAISAGDATLDGLGIDQNEFLLLTFDRTVTLGALSFTGVDDNDDIFVDLFPGTTFTGNSNRFSNPGNPGDFDLDLASLGLTGTQFIVMAGFPNQNTLGGGGTDSFALAGATVAPAPVPVPAALPLALAGFGALAFAGRRRRG